MEKKTKTFAELNEQLKALVGEIEEAIKKELKELRAFEENNSERIRGSRYFITGGIDIDSIDITDILLGHPSTVNYLSQEYEFYFDMEDGYAQRRIEDYKMRFKRQDEQAFEEYQRKEDTQYQEYLRLKALYE